MARITWRCEFDYGDIGTMSGDVVQQVDGGYLVIRDDDERRVFVKSTWVEEVEDG